MASQTAKRGEESQVQLKLQMIDDLTELGLSALYQLCRWGMLNIRNPLNCTGVPVPFFIKTQPRPSLADEHDCLVQARCFSEII